jgi:hypothetical protein
MGIETAPSGILSQHGVYEIQANTKHPANTWDGISSLESYSVCAQTSSLIDDEHMGRLDVLFRVWVVSTDHDASRHFFFVSAFVHGKREFFSIASNQSWGICCFSIYT